VVIRYDRKWAIIAKQIEDLYRRAFFGRPRLVVLVQIPGVEDEVAVPLYGPLDSRPKASNPIQTPDVPSLGVENDPASDRGTIIQMRIRQMS